MAKHPIGTSMTGAVLTVGNAVQQLPAFAQAAVAEHVAAAREGGVSQTLTAFGQAATAGVVIAANASQTLNKCGQNASVGLVVAGDASQSLNKFSQAATGDHGLILGGAEQSLQGPTQAAAGGVVVSGQAAQQLPVLSQAATAGSVVSGDVSQSLNAFSQSVLGELVSIIEAAIDQQVGMVLQAAAAFVDLAGAGSQQLPVFGQAATGTVSVPGLLSTAGIFTVTNITATRSLNLTTAAINDLANLTGTAIYDIQAGTWNGALYTFAGNIEDREYDPGETLLAELLNAVATAIADNPGTTTFFARRFVFDEWVVLNTLNCLVVYIDELARLIATWLDWRIPDVPGLEYTLPGNRLHYTLPGNRLHYSLSRC